MTYNKILKENNLSEWKIRFVTDGGLCVWKRKEIWLDKSPGTISLFLHEVAHALCPKEVCGTVWTDVSGHNAVWGDCYTMLVEKYMVRRK